METLQRIARWGPRTQLDAPSRIVAPDQNSSSSFSQLYHCAYSHVHLLRVEYICRHHFRKKGVLQIARLLHDSDRVVIALEPGRGSSTNVWGDANVANERTDSCWKAYMLDPGTYAGASPVAGSFERRTVAERARLASFCKVECR